MGSAEAQVSIESAEDSSVDLLQRATGLSKRKIKRAMTAGAVWVSRGRNAQRLRLADERLTTLE